jgi:hypothetical protein
VPTNKELADEYAKRIAKHNTPQERERELENIRSEIRRLTSGGTPLSENQIAHILRELKGSLKELGFDESILALEHHKGAEELSKSLSISNDELLALMSMVSRGPKN